MGDECDYSNSRNDEGRTVGTDLKSSNRRNESHYRSTFYFLCLSATRLGPTIIECVAFDGSSVERKTAGSVEPKG